MSSSVTHNVVRTLQLVLSVSLLATAAFLLHYRSQNHSNFTNEPLVSCITGAVAFIYAFWALLNHRQQPDNHRWIYLHGLGCIVVCGLLIAGSTLAFIYSKQGYLCQSFEDAENTGARALVSKSRYPEYHQGRHYAPGQISNGRHDPHRRSWGSHPARVEPDEADIYYPTRQIRGTSNGQRAGAEASEYGQDFVSQGDYYGNLDRRKRELHWIEQRTRDDPKRHIQGPIPMSMQQNFYGGASAAAATISVSDVSKLQDGEHRSSPHIKILVGMGTVEGAPAVTVEPPLGEMDHSDTNIADHGQEHDYYQHLQSNSPLQVPTHALSPPPGPRTKWEQAPDSIKSGGGGNGDGLYLNIPPRLPPGLVTPPALQTTQLPSPVCSSPVCSSPVCSSPECSECSQRQQPQHNPQQNVPAPENESESQYKECSTSTASPSDYIELPPGPACYVFDSTQHEYLPSFVNMAARIEQQHSNRIQGSGAGCSTPGLSASTPLISPSSAKTNSQRIVVTGLGFDVVLRDESEMAAEASDQSDQTSDTQQAQHSAAFPSNPTHPKKIAMLSVQSPLGQPLSSANGSYFPVASASVPIRAAMPPITGSPKPFMSSKSVDQTSVSETSQQQVPREQTNKKTARTKRKSSKLSVVTLKGNIGNNSSNNDSSNNSSSGYGSGAPSGQSSAMTGGSASASSNTSSPRSPYVGDF